eukprot:1136165-Rhodomonas_salina.4
MPEQKDPRKERVCACCGSSAAAQALLGLRGRSLLLASLSGASSSSAKGLGGLLGGALGVGLWGLRVVEACVECGADESAGEVQNKDGKQHKAQCKAIAAKKKGAGK